MRARLVTESMHALGGAPLHALFQKRVAGDDALLGLARLRFEQAGLAAEVYAGSEDELEHGLRFVPEQARAPMVHLSREVDVLQQPGRDAVVGFARRFGERVSGFVVHDRREAPQRLDELEEAASGLSAVLAESGSARLFVEYAAGAPVLDFVEMGRRLAGADRVGLCIDTGHVGIREARRAFERIQPDLGVDLADLEPGDERLPELVDDVQSAVAAGLPAVLELTRSLAAQGKPVHYHLHDGHPLIHGLADHRGFLYRQPVPFLHRGRRSLDPLFGVAGLASIVRVASEAHGADCVSFTLEIHQGEGRLPLSDDAAELFQHWRDTTNAQRMNAWLAVLADNAALVAASYPS